MTDNKGGIMKIFTNKNITQKIIIALVFVILFNFVSPQISFGGIGGVLFEPIKDLTLTLADGAVWILQKVIFGLDSSILKLRYDKSWTSQFAAWGTGIVAGIGIVVGLIAAPFTGGLSLGVVAAGIAGGALAGYGVGKLVANSIPQTFYLPLYAISPAEIFSNRIAMLDVNFFNPNDYEKEDTVAGTGKEQKSTAAQLQAVISQWYFTIRNFAIVALLSILVYTGIKIIISSSAQDKAKYKQRLMDWVISMCLLFFLHYIMAFAVTITQLIVQSLNGVNQNYVQVIGNDQELKDYRWDFQTVTDEGESETVDTFLFTEDSEMYKALHNGSFILDGIIKDDGSISGEGHTLVWPTNLMGKARIEAQLKVDGEDGDNTLIRQFGYTIIFLGLVIYTILFLFRYLKRLLMLAFLTIIAPFVAMTYPLDKMNDGSAQAFNTWLKEYIYNLLIQPVHLILYTVLVGSAISFVADNLLYALAAFGFILQAEKIMRKFFGFEKASTLAGGSALGGAMAMQGINMLRRMGGGKGKQKGGAVEKGKENDKVRFSSRKPDKERDTDSLLDNVSKGKDIDEVQKQEILDENSKRFGINYKDQAEKDAMVRNVYAGEHGSLNNYPTVEYPNTLPGNRETSSVARTPVAHTSQASKTQKPRRIKGVAAVAGKGLKGLGKGVRYVAPKAARMALKGTVAGAAATGGIAAGLVSEDYGNVVKWGAAGAGAGWIGAGGAISKTTGMVESASDTVDRGLESIASTYTIAAHGFGAEEQRQKDKEDKAAMKDKARRELYARKLKLDSKAQIDKAMKESQEYRRAGITDDDLVIKAMKSDDFKGDRASEERIIAASLAQKVKEQSGNENQKMKIATDMMAEHNMSQEDIKKYDKGIRKLIR